MSLPVLTYFSSRGLAELIRLTLAEAGVAYEERHLGVYPDLTAFNELKATGVLPFGAVPLWEEPSGLALVQSDAILRHTARTAGLYGADAREAARCDMVYQGVQDVRSQLMRLRSVDPAGRAALRAELADAVLPRWLGYFEGILGDAACFAGTFSFSDLAVWYLFEALRDNGLAGALLARPRLVAFEASVAARPNLAAYLAAPGRFPPQLLPV